MNQTDVINRLCTLNSGDVGVIKAVTLAGNYWVRVGHRYVLAEPGGCRLNGRNRLPDMADFMLERNEA